MINLNCDDCPYSAYCVFDDETLTEDQQDAKCPEVGRMTSEPPSHLSDRDRYKKYREEKLLEVKALLPVKFSEIVRRLDVPEATLRSWYIYFMTGHNVGKGRQRVLYVTGVSLTRKDRIEGEGGHMLNWRQVQLEKSARFIETRGEPIALTELSGLLGISHSTVRYWIGRYVTAEKRVVPWNGKQQKILFVTGIM